MKKSSFYTQEVLPSLSSYAAFRSSQGSSYSYDIQENKPFLSGGRMASILSWDAPMKSKNGADIALEKARGATSLPAAGKATEWFQENIPTLRRASRAISASQKSSYPQEYGGGILGRHEESISTSQRHRKSSVGANKNSSVMMTQSMMQDARNQWPEGYNAAASREQNSGRRRFAWGNDSSEFAATLRGDGQHKADVKQMKKFQAYPKIQTSLVAREEKVKQRSQKLCFNGISSNPYRYGVDVLNYEGPKIRSRVRGLAEADHLDRLLVPYDSVDATTVTRNRPSRSTIGNMDQRLIPFEAQEVRLHGKQMRHIESGSNKGFVHTCVPPLIETRLSKRYFREQLANNLQQDYVPISDDVPKGRKAAFSNLQSSMETGSCIPKDSKSSSVKVHRKRISGNLAGSQIQLGYD